MPQRPPSLPNEVIRISRDEATSSHVDDLLMRQMSLRGERGISRDRQSRWYFQNWFVFMITGGIAALCAWAILEPFMEDSIYLQGEVQEVGVERPADIADPSLVSQVVRVNGQTILLGPSTHVVGASEETQAPLPQIEPGQTVGFYVEWLPWLGNDTGYALHVEFDPPADRATDPHANLDSLSAASEAASMLFFPLVAAFIGLGLGAVDGIVCRLARRVLLAGAVGLAVGFLGGFVCSVLANVIYAPLTELASRQSGDAVGAFTTFGFLMQMGGRALAWAMAGVAMGLGQGIALRSGRLALYGLLGGVLGGLLGGLFFDPIDFLLLGENTPGAEWSRMVGLVVIGMTVGAMIGVVELLARDAWLCMTRGPLAGKEFLVFKDTMRMGCSPKCDIYLFNDDAVDQQHAILRATGDAYELENLSELNPVTVNGRTVTRSRLRHGDLIGLGSTTFTFNCKRRD